MTDLILQFTPQANVCVLKIVQPSLASLNQTQAFLNRVQLPAYVFSLQERELMKIDQERQKYNKMDEKLTPSMHAHLSKVFFKLGYHTRVSFGHQDYDRQDANLQGYPVHDYFLDPIFITNRTVLSAPQVYPAFYYNSNETGQVERTAEWEGLPPHWNRKLPVEMRIMQNCTLCIQERRFFCITCVSHKTWTDSVSVTLETLDADVSHTVFPAFAQNVDGLCRTCVQHYSQQGFCKRDVVVMGWK